MEKIVLIKEGNKTKKIEADKELIIKLRGNNSTHMCWENCENACPSKCPKIADINKKPIDKYTFINEGIQIVNENGQIETFIVKDCSHYKKEEIKKLTGKRLRELKEIREKLIMTYYGTDTPEEAYIIQDEKESKGEISNIRGKKPSKKIINSMRK